MDAGEWPEGRHKYSELVEPAMDLLCGALVLTYLAIRFPGMVSSADNTARILDALEDIPWSHKGVWLSAYGLGFKT